MAKKFTPTPRQAELLACSEFSVKLDTNREVPGHVQKLVDEGLIVKNERPVAQGAANFRRV